MVFSGLVFLCIFLPVTLLLYNILPGIKAKNVVLLLASLFFYAWGEPKWIIVMIVTCLVDFAAGLLVDKYRGKKASKFFLVISVIITLGMLVVFKYMNFLTHNINLLPFVEIRETSLALPIGISFYTFQAMSYVIDVYRGDVPVQKKFYKLLLYVSMFPQLIAGPIVRYSTISREIDQRYVSFELFSEGITGFVAGLSKKVILANFLGMLVDSTLGGDLKSITCLGAWMGLIAYFFQIYFDFSGYSDMAIGMGKMFGFHFLKNFDYPYTSNSITNFWRKWHISLGSFFRDYVYIPLGGNRRFQLRNMFVVWLLTGLWHGASWNFLLWGLYYFVLLAVEKFIFKNKIEKFKVISRIYTVFFVLMGWVFFYFEDMSSIGLMFKALFGFGAGMSGSGDLIMLKNNIILFAVSVIACIPVGKYVSAILGKLERKTGGMAFSKTVTLAYQAVMLLVCISCLVGSSYNPFLYFRF